jgi:Uncharacterized conserved protein
MIISSKESICAIKYFSALCPWSDDKRVKHSNLMNIYKDCDIQVILGKFKQVEAKCNKRVNYTVCDHKFLRYAEKQTDVNIASQMLKDAYEERMERAYIISRDSDLIPAIKILREMNIKTMVIFPPCTSEVEELKTVCGQHRMLKTGEFDKVLLPDPFQLASGDKISCPENWK